MLLTGKNAVCESTVARSSFFPALQPEILPGCTAQREIRLCYKQFLAFSRTGPGCGKPILVLKTIFGSSVHFSGNSAGGPSAELLKAQRF